MAADLLTFTEWLHATGRASATVDTELQAKAEWAITVASDAIRQYTDRDLVLAADATPGPRTFRYTGHGILEIDDCTDIQQVELTSTPWSPASRVLDATEWIEASSTPNDIVIDYLELWTNLPIAGSPEMGFMRNADRYGWRPHPVELTVTATWGWPTIPPSIKQAAVWTVGAVMSAETPYVSESIAGYSHSFQEARAGGSTTGSGDRLSPSSLAIPERAQSLLAAYTREFV